MELAIDLLFMEATSRINGTAYSEFPLLIKRLSEIYKRLKELVALLTRQPTIIIFCLFKLTYIFLKRN